MQDWTERRIVLAADSVGFRVNDMLVEGRVNTDPDAIRAIVNIRKGDPLFAFEPHEAKEMLEKLSWVKTAEVQRRLPDTIYVSLIERKPLALWQRDGRVSLIAEDGTVLTDNNIERFKDLLIITGKEAPTRAAALIQSLEAEPLIDKRTESASLIAGRRWDIHLDDGKIVKLPEDDLGYALRRLAAMQEEDRILDRDLLSIDVRERDRITVQTRPGEAQDYKAGFQPTSSSSGAL